MLDSYEDGCSDFSWTELYSINLVSPKPLGNIVANKLEDFHDRLNPPFRPPRPNRTLGGTNLRALKVDERPSMSTSDGFSWATEAFSDRIEVGSTTVGIDGIAGSVGVFLISFSAGTEDLEPPLA